MHQLTKIAAVAVTVLASTASHAALQSFYTFDSSLAFFAVDKSNNASVVVDLKYLFNDATSTTFTAPGTTIVWDFNNNTLSRNGAAVAGTYNYSVPFTFFSNAAAIGSTSWGVLAGKAGDFPDFSLTTGNPSPLQLTQQTTDLIANMVLVDSLYQNSNGVVNTATRRTTQNIAGFGANAVVGETTNASGYVAGGGNLGGNLNWQTNLRWSAGTAVGGTSPFWYLDDDSLPSTPSVGNIYKIGGGLFSYNAGVLTWTTPVPEVGTYAMFAAGLMALAFVRRRRA
jgi:hypothetical protein